MAAMLQRCELNCSNKVVIRSFSGQTNPTTQIGERYIAKALLNSKNTSINQSVALKVILLYLCLVNEVIC